jgi:hypothetical protein
VIPELDVVMVMTGGGFEPKDVGDRMGAALRSDHAIPENPAGFELLQRKVSAAAVPPRSTACCSASRRSHAGLE